MKRRLKVVPMALVMVLVFSAVAAASASAAPRWLVAGSAFGSGTEAFEGVSSGTVNLKTGIAGLELTSEHCTTTGSIVGSVMGSPGLDKGVKLKCTEVTVVGSPTKCEVHSVVSGTSQPVGTVETYALKSELVWLKENPTTKESEEEAADLLTPESTETEPPFAEIDVLGSSCPVKQTKALKVTGSILGHFTAPAVGASAATGTLVFPNPALTTYYTGETTPRTKHTGVGLHIGLPAALFSGSFTLHLTSGKTIGVIRS
jgi:hypothetical protein